MEISYKSEPEVRSILGGDFITPAEISANLKFSYSFDELITFHETFPSLKTLYFLRLNNFALIACPPVETSLLEIRERSTQLFRRKSGGWFSKEDELFSRNDKVCPGWLMIRKKLIADSVGRTWKEQRRLVPRGESAPNAAEKAWSILSFLRVRNILLFPDFSTRTSSVDAEENHVVLGRSAFGGVNVYSCWNENCYDYVGITSVLRQDKD